MATIECESGFNPKAIGDHGTSFGIVQIHLPAHPSVTKAQALNPVWALEWAAEQWQAGHASAWSCYRDSI